MADDDGGALQAGFNFYYVSYDLANDVLAQQPEGPTCHVQVVPPGQDPYTAAGAAGTWLGANNVQTVTGLYLVGHGGPGSITIGQDLTSNSIAPLGGWLSSFLDPVCVVRLLGCNCAADSNQTISGYVMGQQNPPTGDLGDGTHSGYNLLLALAQVTQRNVEAALNGQTSLQLGLKMGCRRVYPNGRDEHFQGAGMADPV